MLKYALPITGSIALLSLAYAAFCGALAFRQIATSANLIQVQLNSQVIGARGDINTGVKLVAGILDKQLGRTNQTLESTSGVLLNQTAGVAQGITTTTVNLAATTQSIQKLVDSATVVVKDPDVPKLIRDLRQTTALTGVTMAHIEGMSNTIDKAMPAFVASDASIANSAAGITKDVKKITDAIVAPKPWYRKIFDTIEGFSGLAGLVK